jgi:hypothetical protein
MKCTDLFLQPKDSSNTPIDNSNAASVLSLSLSSVALTAGVVAAIL